MKDLTELEHAELIHVMRFINAELDVLPADRPPLVRIPLPLDLSERQRAELERQYSVAGWSAVVLATRNRRLRVRFPEYLELRRGPARAATASAGDLTHPLGAPDDSPD
jgi:hypothetical protein